MFSHRCARSGRRSPSLMLSVREASGGTTVTVSPATGLTWLRSPVIRLANVLSLIVPCWKTLCASKPRSGLRLRPTTNNVLLGDVGSCRQGSCSTVCGATIGRWFRLACSRRRRLHLSWCSNKSAISKPASTPAPSAPCRRAYRPANGSTAPSTPSGARC